MGLNIQNITLDLELRIYFLVESAVFVINKNLGAVLVIYHSYKHSHHIHAVGS